MELLFADDAVLMADSLEELQQIVDAFVLVTVRRVWPGGVYQED